MKKALAIILTLALAATMLAACGGAASGTAASTAPASGSAASGEAVTINVATSLYVESNHQRTFDKLIAAFNAGHPNIQVTIYGAGWDGFWDNMTTEIANGNEGDILQITPSELSSYYALRDGGAFTDLTDYIANSSIVAPDDLVGQEECNIDGKAVALSNYSYDDVISLYFSVKEEYRSNAVWLMNDDTAMALRKLKDADGNYLWNSNTDSIFRKRVIISKFMPSAEPGKKPIAFGDFSYYWIVLKKPVSVRAIKEKFVVYDQIGYLAFEFLDGKLIRPEAIKVIQMS